VDHPLPPPDALVRPWRTATLLACGVAALELVLLIVLGGALIAKEATTPAARPKAKASRQTATANSATRSHAVRRVVPAPPAAKLARSKLRVLVLNGNGRHGAAGAAADRLRRRGYRIGGVTNARRMDYARSLVMYRRGFAGEGARLARDLGVAVVGPLDGMRPSQLQRSHLVLIVGA
jgi:hypothetical protein